MKFVRGNHRSGKLREDGLSLVEVIVAIAIISIIALSSASLTINGVALASSTERQQVAVTIANGAMETASAQSVATIYSGRKTGRCHRPPSPRTPRSPSWPGSAPPIRSGIRATPIPPAEALPITPPTITQSGTTYATTVLVGSCYQPRAGGDCARLPANPTTPPATAPAGYMPLIRVIVVVRWTATKSCAPGGCYYSATTLIDPSSDLEWVTHV